jgi:hypothetical protein
MSQLRRGSASPSADAAEQALCETLPPLPPALVLRVFALLPVDACARAACVSRTWRRAVLAAARVRTRLDLSRSSGVSVRVTDAVLRAASGLAHGGLTALDVSGRAEVRPDELLAVVTANAFALTELRACKGAYLELSYAEVEALLRAAPLLRVLHADVQCEAGEQLLLSMLRYEAPFGPLRMHRLHVRFLRLTPAEHAAAVTALAAATAAHDSLSSLKLEHAALRTPAVLDAVVDAALLRRIRSLELDACDLTPASAPALARLLGGGVLTELRIWNDRQRHLLDAPAAALLADALRANSTLTTLHLAGFRLWRDKEAMTALLGALVGHPSLRKLCIHDGDMAVHAAVAGAALGALVAANAPALRELNCQLGDDGLGPLVDALPANTHLRTLSASLNGISEGFARERLLPAVRANSGLRELHAGYSPAVLEARWLVAARMRAANHAQPR